MLAIRRSKLPRSRKRAWVSSWRCRELTKRMRAPARRSCTALVSQRVVLAAGVRRTLSGSRRWKFLKLWPTRRASPGRVSNLQKAPPGAASNEKTLETAERLLAKLSTTSGDRAFLLAILALGKLDADEPDAGREVF